MKAITLVGPAHTRQVKTSMPHVFLSRSAHAMCLFLGVGLALGDPGSSFLGVGLAGTISYIVFVPHSFGRNCPRHSSVIPGRNAQKNLYLTAENRGAKYSDWVFDNHLFIESAGVFLPL